MKNELKWLKVIAEIKNSTVRKCTGVRNGKKCGSTKYSEWNNLSSPAATRYCLKCNTVESLIAHTAFHHSHLSIDTMIKILLTMRNAYNNQVYFCLDADEHNDERYSKYNEPRSRERRMTFTLKNYYRYRKMRPTETELAKKFNVNRKSISKFLKKAASCVTEDYYGWYQEFPGIVNPDYPLPILWFNKIRPEYPEWSGKAGDGTYERLYFLLFDKKSEPYLIGTARNEKDIIHKLVTKQPYKLNKRTHWYHLDEEEQDKYS